MRPGFFAIVQSYIFLAKRSKEAIARVRQELLHLPLQGIDVMEGKAVFN